MHAGAGAYICGEETALLDSLEGRRGQPRLRPPFPAVAGLYACPTVVNNVESIASVPAICTTARTGSRRWAARSPPGFTLYSLSGHVTSPGQYEAPLGITLRQLLDMGGGMRAGPPAEVLDPRRLVDPDVHRRAPRRAARLRGVGAAGSMLGTRALQSSTRRPAWCGPSLRWTEFYAHESCGKCTPCREGTYWLVQMLRGSRPARAARPTSTSCSTSATTSSAGRSARWATARPARSCPRSSTSATSTSQHIDAAAAAPSTRPVDVHAVRPEVNA